MTYHDIPSAFTVLCPMLCIKLCPKTCVCAELNISAGCTLMGKPCLCWLNTADVQGSTTVRNLTGHSTLHYDRGV